MREKLADDVESGKVRTIQEFGRRHVDAETAK